MIDEKRQRHMQKVAEFMYENAEKYGLDKFEMYALGLLHDIGYIGDEKHHEKEGQKLLEKENYKYAFVIGCHGLTPNEYIDLYGENIPKELVLLWEADMNVDVEKGEKVGFEERLEDIKRRRGEESSAYRTSKERVEWLKENMKNYH